MSSLNVAKIGQTWHHDVLLDPFLCRILGPYRARDILWCTGDLHRGYFAGLQLRFVETVVHLRSL
jgi:hypothetical protein